jgi:hypothetical protein
MEVQGRSCALPFCKERLIEFVSAPRRLPAHLARFVVQVIEGARPSHDERPLSRQPVKGRRHRLRFRTGGLHRRAGGSAASVLAEAARRKLEYLQRKTEKIVPAVIAEFAPD